MAFLFKMVLLFLGILFLITVIRIALSVLKVLSLPMAEAKRRESEAQSHARQAGGGNTIELGKKDYKVE